jgi:hypothetical protein
MRRYSTFYYFPRFDLFQSAVFHNPLFHVFQFQVFALPASNYFLIFAVSPRCSEMSPFRFRNQDLIDKSRSDVWAFVVRKSGQDPTDGPRKPQAADRLRGISADADAIARRQVR